MTPGAGWQSWLRDYGTQLALEAIKPNPPNQFCGSRIRAFLAPRSGMGKKSIFGSGMNIPDHISESLENVFGVKT